MSTHPVVQRVRRPSATTAQAALPELVRRYLERSVFDPSLVPRRVQITQEGQMWQKPGGRALRFTAVQDLAVDRVAFSWRARFPIVGPLAIRVVDEYAGGEGRLEARLLGVPLQRQSGHETAVGEVLRYLAELPWVPHAITRNRELTWRELDAARVEVATTLGSERIALELVFDAAGDIARVFAPERPRMVGKLAVPTAWASATRSERSATSVDCSCGNRKSSSTRRNQLITRFPATSPGGD